MLFVVSKRLFAKRLRRMIPPIFEELKETPEDKLDRIQEESEQALEPPSGPTSNQQRFIIAQKNGTLTQELFKTYDLLEKETQLDLTNWRYGFQNVSKLADLEFEALMNSSSRMTVKYEDSWNYQDAAVMETSINYFKNDLHYTLDYMTILQDQGYLSPDMYHKYRALLYSLVDHVKISRSLKNRTKVVKKDLGEVLEKVSTAIHIDLERYNLNEKKEVEDISMEHVRKAVRKLLSQPKEYDLKEFSQTVMEKDFEDANKAEAHLKSLILVLVDMLVKNNINIRNDKILTEAKELFEGLSSDAQQQFEVLIGQSRDLLYKLHNPLEISKPVYGFEMQPHVTEDIKLARTRFSKNSIPIRNKVV